MNISIYTGGKKNLLIEKQDLGLYSGDIQIVAPETKTPKLAWGGTCIDRNTFRQALAFLKWTHDTHKVEGQARFFYNEDTGAWQTVVLPQYIWSSGHTREVEQDNEIKEKTLAKLSLAGFGEAGTIHHHSGMGAFQSGGDLDDELSRHGFHVTVGLMNSPVADFHARATFKGIHYEAENGMINISQWIPGLRSKRTPGSYISHPLEPEGAKFWLDLKELPTFPEEWKKHLVPRPVESTASQHGTSSRTHQHWQSNTTKIESPSEAINRKHRGEIPLFKDKRVTVWTTVYNPRSRLKITNREPEESKKLAKTTANSPVTDNPPRLTVGELRELRGLSPDAFDRRIEELCENEQIDNSQVHIKLKETFAETLAEFRTEHFEEDITAIELKHEFAELQAFSSQFLRTLKIVADADKAQLSQESIRDLTLSWMHLLTDKLMDLHPEEWDSVFSLASTQQNAEAFDFYELMCTGLSDGVDFGFFEDIYMLDGTMNGMFADV